MPGSAKRFTWWPRQGAGEKTLAHDGQELGEYTTTVEISLSLVDSRVDREDLDSALWDKALQAINPEMAVTSSSTAAEQVEDPNDHLAMLK
jgi:hypothetical protein